ncbi:DUF6636 domain-containing protein [Mycobacterium shigaense]|uniref:DUF6636 domain-containing protein n=1 Tax=Mycobacterium shigaense TaxID=722731 RepID=UPI002ADFEF88|nr:DUF6636 domain-containing protein [Mycobacterium shigaense]MEA1125072.1 DUF6636 domain-containing protein [Mycobacterium shigaense]
MDVKTVASAAIALAAVGRTATAHADTVYQFQSPSGNITRVMSALPGTTPRASCGAIDHTWVIPPRPMNCVGAFGDQIDLAQGSSPAMTCHTDTTRGSALPTLEYGESRSAATLTCVSELASITCTDLGTGHYFRISRESFQLR